MLGLLLTFISTNILRSSARLFMAIAGGITMR